MCIFCYGHFIFVKNTKHIGHMKSTFSFMFDARNMRLHRLHVKLSRYWFRDNVFLFIVQSCIVRDFLSKHHEY